jgi:hypothetical protein
MGVAWPLFPGMGEDSGAYRDLMLNHWSTVHQPFSSRFLHAEVARLLMNQLHAPLLSVVSGLAVGGLAVIVVGIGWILSRQSVPAFVVVPMLVSSTLVNSVRLVYMPDLFYTVLLVGLFILLMNGQVVVSAVMIFVLFCARESTIVLGVVMIVLSAGWGEWRPVRDSKRMVRVGALAAATAIGFSFNRYVTSKSASNMHEMNGAMYMVGKILFNFMRNVIGIAPWTDTLAATEGDHPIWARNLPRWIHLGVIHQVGINRMTVGFPLFWLTNTVCSFGVLFTVVLRELVGVIREREVEITGRFRELRAVYGGLAQFVKGEPFYSRVALLYGLISLLMAPMLGTAVHRYIYYSWPLFWITGVGSLQRRYLRGRRGNIQLLLLHLALVWMPVLISWTAEYWYCLLGLLGVGVALQAMACKVLARQQMPAV